MHFVYEHYSIELFHTIRIMCEFDPIIRPNCIQLWKLVNPPNPHFIQNKNDDFGIKNMYKNYSENQQNAKIPNKFTEKTSLNQNPQQFHVQNNPQNKIPENFMHNIQNPSSENFVQNVQNIQNKQATPKKEINYLQNVIFLTKLFKNKLKLKF